MTEPPLDADGLDAIYDEPEKISAYEVRLIIRHLYRLWEAKREAEHLQAEVWRLAEFIIDNVPGEPSQSGGVVDTAIRIMSEQAAELEHLRADRPATELREAEERGYERGRADERRDVVAWLEAAAEDYMASGLRCQCKGRVDCTTALYDEAGDIKGGRHIAAGEHVQADGSTITEADCICTYPGCDDDSQVMIDHHGNGDEWVTCEWCKANITDPEQPCPEVASRGGQADSSGAMPNFIYTADDVLAVCDSIRPMSDGEYAAWREACEHVQLRPTDTGASDRGGQADSQGSAKPGSDHGSWEDPHQWHDSFGERYCEVCGIDAEDWDATLPTIDEISGTVGNLSAPVPPKRRMMRQQPGSIARLGHVGEHQENPIMCPIVGCVPVTEGSDDDA